MCSGRAAAAGGAPGHGGGSRSGSQYALCALGVGLVALGVVMIVWTVVPQDADSASGAAGNATGNTTVTVDDGSGAGGDIDSEKSRKASSSVAYVLVGAGLCMLLLSICLGVRSKRRERQRAGEAGPVGAPFMDHAAGEPGEAVPVPTYDVPSYEEAVGSGQYPISASNLRHSTSQLPSYEDLISAVDAEGEGPSGATPATEDPPATPAASEPEPNPAPSPASASLPSRSGSSRASRILRPLRVRRIKSDKLHLKDFRIMIRNPTQAPVTIEPITPPPQYDDKAPEF